LGSSGIFSGAILIISYTVPLSQRPLYTGLVSAMYGIASVAGPLMGGAFTDNKHLTWRWCFYINLPFGAVTALFIFLFYKNPKRHTRQKKGIIAQLDQMDLPGTAVFLPGIICLLLALQWGGTKYAWNSGRIIALLILAGLLLISFLAIQVIRGEKATVAPRVFKNRSIFGSAIYAFCIGGAFFVILFYVSFICKSFSRKLTSSSSQSTFKPLRTPLPSVLGSILYHSSSPWYCFRFSPVGLSPPLVIMLPSCTWR
jgi:predicted MFS family arabinose efflux permease